VGDGRQLLPGLGRREPEPDDRGERAASGAGDRRREELTLTRIGISGCGAIGRSHARRLKTLGADLVFYSRTREKAASFARGFGGAVCGGYDELVAACDGVVVASPPAAHVDQVVAGLAGGTPVLAEKPLCTSREELGRIEKAAASAPSGAFVMVAENHYYKPVLVRMREILARNGIGRVVRIGARKLNSKTTEGWKSAYGCLLEGGIHFVAQAADLADAALARGQDPAPVRAPTSVAAEFPTAVRGRPERHAKVRLEYEGGLRADVQYAWDVPVLLQGAFQHDRVEGEAGRILYEINGLYLHVGGRGRRGLSIPSFVDGMGYRAMMADFLRCLESGDAPYSSLARGRRDLEVVFRAYEQLP
jgi:predicted dehydrogenase